MSLLNRVAIFDLAERKASPDGLKVFPSVLSTETPVPRRDVFGKRYGEVLSHAPGAVDLSRSPLPVLEQHDRSRVRTSAGSTTGRSFHGKLRGDLVLGKSARAAELAADIEAGIVSGLSVSYR